jgi:hypothetical protein
MKSGKLLLVLAVLLVFLSASVSAALVADFGTGKTINASGSVYVLTFKKGVGYVPGVVFGPPTAVPSVTLSVLKNESTLKCYLGWLFGLGASETVSVNISGSFPFFLDCTDALKVKITSISDKQVSFELYVNGQEISATENIVKKFKAYIGNGEEKFVPFEAETQQAVNEKVTQSGIKVENELKFGKYVIKKINAKSEIIDRTTYSAIVYSAEFEVWKDGTNQLDCGPPMYLSASIANKELNFGDRVAECVNEQFDNAKIMRLALAGVVDGKPYILVQFPLNGTWHKTMDSLNAAAGASQPPTVNPPANPQQPAIPQPAVVPPSSCNTVLSCLADLGRKFAVQVFS